MGGTPITNQVAEKALRKLRAVRESGDAHPNFGIYHEGRLVARTGMRHSPKKDMPLPHIKKDLRVNAEFVLDLARCPKSFDDWLKAVGVVATPEDPETQD